MQPELVHIDLLQSLINAPAYLPRLDAEVFRGEGDVILDDVCDDLVIGVLKHHPNRSPDIDELVFIIGIHSVNEHRALRRREDGVQMLCKRALSGAVMTQDSDEASLFYLKIYAAEAFKLVARICVMQIFNADYTAHSQSLSHRQVAPQGSTRPESVTGRPSSRLSEHPPNFFVNILSVTYDSTEGDRPVV